MLQLPYLDCSYDSSWKPEDKAEALENIKKLKASGYNVVAGIPVRNLEFDILDQIRKEDGKAYHEFAAKGLYENEHGKDREFRINRVTIGHDVDYEEEMDLLYKGVLSFSDHNTGGEPFWMITRASKAKAGARAAFTDAELDKDPD